MGRSTRSGDVDEVQSSGQVDVDSRWDLERVRALRAAGLGPAPDDELDRYAERVTEQLGVPVAHITLIEADQQVFPGQAGLAEPLATDRRTPLTHSFCRHVVTAGRPFVVTDARTDPRVRDNPAVVDHDAIAYLGVPLTDGQGYVLGSLCAVDHRPRMWTEQDHTALTDLAHSCSVELRLRLARHDAATERARRDASEAELRDTLERNRVLLVASQAFTATTTVADVRRALSELVSSDLRPDYIGLVLLEDGRLRRHFDERFPPGPEATGPYGGDYPIDDVLPTATAVRENRVVLHTTRDDFDAEHPEPARQLLRELGLQACLAAPLPGPAGGPIGAVALGWHHARALLPTDLLVVTTIAGYAGQALTRAQRLANRIDGALQLQESMLTTLPVLPGLRMAARYLPADSRQRVGGDWYDAIVLPRPPSPSPSGGTSVDRPAPPVGTVAVSVGDIVGHELRAAALMGQVRSMLRQASWDHPADPPSRAMAAFEHAATGTALGALGTAVLAHLVPGPDGDWTLHWTNAGHPPPILMPPDGPAELLTDHDALFGLPAALRYARRDHRRDLRPGSTLFLYTDGLVERRGSDIDTGTAALLELLDRLGPTRPRDLVHATTAALAAGSTDDVVAFAIHLSAP